MKELVLSCVLILMLLSNPLSLFAQSAPQGAAGSWETVKSVPVGSELVVKLKDGTTVKARHAGASDTAVTASRKNRLQEIQRSAIQRVSILVKSDKDKAQAIGAGIGALALPLTTVGVLTDSDAGEATLWVVIVALIGAGIGYLIGSLVGLPRKTVLIYEAG